MDHRRVLVVDDDPVVRRMLAEVLRRQLLNVDEAADGATALGFLRDNLYAVILLDLLMPGTDGFAVLEAMRTSQVPVPPVVLVITGVGRDVVERLDPLQIHGVIRKPFDPEEIGSIVAACTEIRARTSFGAMALAMAGSSLLAWWKP
jgi:CheY-like chemotaxis protein